MKSHKIKNAIIAGALCTLLAVPKDAETISELVHPTKGVRFTPYTYVSLESDVIFSKEEVLQSALKEVLQHLFRTELFSPTQDYFPHNVVGAPWGIARIELFQGLLNIGRSLLTIWRRFV